MLLLLCQLGSLAFEENAGNVSRQRLSRLDRVHFGGQVAVTRRRQAATGQLGPHLLNVVEQG